MNYNNRLRKPNHDHAWRGTWDRPMKMDEDLMDAFTIARMTDHNVRASDNETFSNNRKFASKIPRRDSR